MTILIALVFAICLGARPVHASWFSDAAEWVVDGASAVGGAVVSGVGALVGAAGDALSWAACNVGDVLCKTNSSFQQKLQAYASDSCWFCGVFGDIFDILNDIATEVCAGLQGLFLTLLGLGLLFWLLFRVGKMVLDISPKVDTALLPDILKQVMRVMVASLMITFYLDVFDYGISPLLQLSIGMGNQLTAHELSGYDLFGSRSGDRKSVV